MSTEPDKCEICHTEKYRYVCPKCNVPYCSVACYKSPTHLKCSEEFYKNCIQEEFNSSAKENCREDVRKMYDILKRIQQADAGINPTDFDADGLDEPLDSDDDVPVNTDESGESVLEQEEDEEDDIATRLQGVDINDADNVWSRLTVEEQEEFQNLIESGDIMKLLPDYKPWWHKRHNSKIVVLSAKGKEENKTDIGVPMVCEHIPDFKDIFKNAPSPCLHFNLWNILSAYACVVRFLNGEHLTNASEAVAHLVNLSATLKYGTNFEDAEDAILSVEMEALTTRNGTTGATSSIGSGSSILVENREQLQEDARLLMSVQHYKLAALSDILQLLLLAKEEAKSRRPDQADFQKLFALCSGSVELNRKKLQQILKKIEFMLAYVDRDSSNEL